MEKNQLLFGDNLHWLREHFARESVDLVYLDPPFNSKADYNVLFKEQDGSQASAQVKAFVDTWEWNEESSRTYFDFIESPESPDAAKRALIVLHDLLGGRGTSGNSMIAYLSMMAPRLVQLHRILKPTGSIYLHCDPKASHYLKILLDSIFGAGNFRNEIVWKRTSSHSGSRRFGPVHDTIFFYSKSKDYIWNPQFEAMTKDRKGRHDLVADPDGRLFRTSCLTGSGRRGGESGKPWRTHDPDREGRHWGIPRELCVPLGVEGASIPEKLDALHAADLIYYPEGESLPRYKVYIDADPGMALGTVWTDIAPINSQAQERLGYPTQKPEALLERILRSSSNEGDVILDPFCGCGTAVAVAQRLNRRWIGIDITYLAIDLIKRRLLDSHGAGISKTYQVLGEPTDVNEAKALAREEDGRYQFQYWALSKLDARLVDQDKKKGTDKGVDGRSYFHDDVAKAETKKIIYSVKSGTNIGATDIRDLKGAMERERAAIGVFVTLYDPTKPMRDEANDAGFYTSPGWRTKHRRVQIITVAEMFEGKTVDMPKTQDQRTFKKAPKRRRPDYCQMDLISPLDEQPTPPVDPDALRAELAAAGIEAEGDA